MPGESRAIDARKGTREEGAEKERESSTLLHSSLVRALVARLLANRNGGLSHRL